LICFVLQRSQTVKYDSTAAKAAQQHNNKEKQVLNQLAQGKRKAPDNAYVEEKSYNP
jgi:hypothetical protein